MFSCGRFFYIQDVMSRAGFVIAYFIMSHASEKVSPRTHWLSRIVPRSGKCSWTLLIPSPSRIHAPESSLREKKQRGITKSAPTLPKGRSLVLKYKPKSRHSSPSILDNRIWEILLASRPRCKWCGSGPTTFVAGNEDSFPPCRLYYGTYDLTHENGQAS